MNKINAYTCKHGHQTVTINTDDGTTPMQINCRNFDLATLTTCGETAMSAFYQCDQGLKPVFEWYKPAPGEKMGKRERAHVKAGGLLLRRIGADTSKKIFPAPVVPKRIIGRNDPCPCGSGVKFKNCHWHLR